MVFYLCDDFIIRANIFTVAYFKELETQTETVSRPSWLVSKTSAHKVLHGHSSRSSHHIDYGTYGHDPLHRPYVRKTGMASTTSDLMTGTSRDTHHVPGYCGFIPRAGNNPQAVHQGDGLQSRSNREDLRLYHKDDLPGYTGHKPDSCANYRGKMMVSESE